MSTIALTKTKTSIRPRTPAAEAIASARRHLLSIQRADGAWWGELEGDTILESEFILAMQFLGRADDPRVRKAAAGMREYRCSPWSTVTYTPRGWKGPCYLIGLRFSKTFDELWTGTDWDYWESREDPGCRNCAMHSGFEASVVREVPRHPGDLLRLFAWNLLG